MDKAQPISYENLISIENIPSIFKDFNLNFYIDDQVIKTINFNYDDSISEEDFPEIPLKENHYAKWENFDSENLKFDADIHALYYPYLTLLESKEKRNGPLPIILVEGLFVDQDFLLLKEDDSQSPLVEEGAILLEQWNINIPEDGNSRHNIRYLPLNNAKNLEVYILADGQWRKTDSHMDGKYLVFEANGENVTFSITESPFSYLEYDFLIFIVILIIIIFILIIFGVKRKKSKVQSSV